MLTIRFCQNLSHKYNKIKNIVTIITIMTIMVIQTKQSINKRITQKLMKEKNYKSQANKKVYIKLRIKI